MKKSEENEFLNVTIRLSRRYLYRKKELVKEDLITNTFVRIQKKLFAQAARILYDNDSAEDVLMETFCRAYEKQYPVASDSEAERILFRIVRNMSVSELRKRRRSLIARVDEMPDTEDDNQNEEKERMIRSMENNIEGRLTETQKYILRRKEYEGASIEEVAAELDMQEAAVRKQLSRARITLREALRHEE